MQASLSWVQSRSLGARRGALPPGEGLDGVAPGVPAAAPGAEEAEASAADRFLGVRPAAEERDVSGDSLSAENACRKDILPVRFVELDLTLRRQGNKLTNKCNFSISNPIFCLQCLLL